MIPKRKPRKKMAPRRMIMGSVWVCPENESSLIFKFDTEELINRQAESDGFKYKRVRGEYATRKNFDLLWRLQTTFDKSPSNTEKFRNIALDGRLLFMEVEHE
jgi:hypothetical protein